MGCNIQKIKYRNLGQPACSLSFGFRENKGDRKMMYEMQEQHHPLPLIREGLRKTVDRRRRRSAVDDEMVQAVDLSGLSLDSLPNPSINLSIISRLDLSNNNLRNIPESVMARLLKVVDLDIHSNQLKSLPNSIGCLSKLKVLNVSSNLLESLPKTIENCRSLEELNANFNKLRMLPETLGFELINLKKLLVSSNKLVILPRSTSHLTSLRELDAHLNCLTCLPNDLENLVHLQALNVSQNFHHLTALPYSIGLLLSLVDLDVSYNNITSLPNSIGCLKSLETLSIDGNPLVSPPPEIVKRGLAAMKDYLGAKMRGHGEPKKKSWVRKLVKYATFNGTTGSTISCDQESSILPECHLIDGLASPRYTGMFSPRRLFSPRKVFR